MIRAILFKEYCKIHRGWLALFLLHLALLAYIFIDTRQLFVADKAEMVWYQLLHLGQIYYEPFKYLPVISGIIISLIQYLPEMRDERLRLSLHLPIAAHRLIFAHLTAGILAIALLLLPDLLILTAISRIYFPPEICLLTLKTVTPWVLAGFASYLGGALTILEPSIRLRLINAALGLGVSGLFLLSCRPGGYWPAIFLLLIPLLLMIPAALLPAHNFRLRRSSK
ncbi:MAG: hypothetical protein CSB24_02010 [Deltaproteobacteria bacterium]|nr:MAG: hypothetical protein CSB24_02010 [Deltaproteobacteria bacterium]